MKAYKFSIVSRPAVIGNGELFEPQTVFSCKVLVDRNTDLTAFAEQLLSFWVKSNAIGEAHDKWKYEATMPIEVPIQEISN